MSKELVEFFPVFEHFLNQSELIRQRYNEVPLCKYLYNFFLLPPKQRKSVMDKIQALVAQEDFSPSHFTQLALLQSGEFNIKR
ncbi:hypothetical protein [Kangiella shandongensis]|uniref:hypothetical protein n=1 Tax=Kangiella shandongensis TaxID=2763258 RepID=UPI001CBBABA8|nr:hypothetical protein [Kangiella shandongensis]